MLIPAVVADDWRVKKIDWRCGDLQAANFTLFVEVESFLLVIKLLHHIELSDLSSDCLYNWKLLKFHDWQISWT